MSEVVQKIGNVFTLIVAISALLASAGTFYTQMSIGRAIAELKYEMSKEFERIEQAREFRLGAEKRFAGVEQCCYELQRSFERMGLKRTK